MPSFTHPWATRAARAQPRPPEGQDTVLAATPPPPPVTQLASGGTALLEGRHSEGALGRVPAAQGHRQALPRPAQGATATCGSSHAAPVPGGGSGAARGRPRARPPRQSGRRPRSPGGDFDPAAGRACRHLLPAGCAAAAAAPPPSGTLTAEPLRPARRCARRGHCPRPRCYRSWGTNFPRRALPGAAASPQSCPAPGAAGAAADSQLSPAATHPSGTAAQLPLAPRPPAAAPAALRWRTHNFLCEPPPSVLPFSSPFFPAPRGPALRRPLPRPRRPLCWPGSAAGAGGPPRPRPLLRARGGRGRAGPGRRGGEGKGREGRSGAGPGRAPAPLPQCCPAPPRAPPEVVPKCCPAPLLPWGLPVRTCALPPLLLPAPLPPQMSAVAQHFGGEAPRGVP